MKYAVDCWEYDIKAAGKHFLEQHGFKLSDEKEKYVIEVGLTFKEHKDLQEKFYKELHQFLVEGLPKDVNIIRYYVDEVVIDRRIEEWNHPYWKVNEKHIKFILIDTPTTFVKVYDDHVKISKGFPLQAPDLWRDVGNTMYDSTNLTQRHKLLSNIVRKFLRQKYPVNNYILRTKRGEFVIATKNLLFKLENNDLPNSLPPINEEVYYDLCFRYIHPLF